MCVCVCVCVCVCMYVCLHVCMHIGMYVCTYVCKYVCMHVYTTTLIAILRIIRHSLTSTTSGSSAPALPELDRPPFALGPGRAAAARGAPVPSALPTEPARRPLDGRGAPGVPLALQPCVNRATGHTHTDREQHPRHRHRHTHEKSNTPNSQTNTSHKQLTTLEGGATTVRATSVKEEQVTANL